MLDSYTTITIELGKRKFEFYRAAELTDDITLYYWEHNDGRKVIISWDRDNDDCEIFESVNRLSI